MIDQDMVDEAALAWDNGILRDDSAADTIADDHDTVKYLLHIGTPGVFALYFRLNACPRGILTYAAARQVDGGLEYALRRYLPDRLWVSHQNPDTLPPDLLEAYLKVAKELGT